jgi:hypothetical protein
MVYQVEKFRDGGIGRHTRLKILRSHNRAGSSPAPVPFFNRSQGLPSGRATSRKWCDCHRGSDA